MLVDDIVGSFGEGKSCGRGGCHSFFMRLLVGTIAYATFLLTTVVKLSPHAGGAHPTKTDPADSVIENQFMSEYTSTVNSLCCASCWIYVIKYACAEIYL